MTPGLTFRYSQGLPNTPKLNCCDFIFTDQMQPFNMVLIFKSELEYNLNWSLHTLTPTQVLAPGIKNHLRAQSYSLENRKTLFWMEFILVLKAKVLARKLIFYQKSLIHSFLTNMYCTFCDKNNWIQKHFFFYHDCLK